jgi:hypothetical protein
MYMIELILSYVVNVSNLLAKTARDVIRKRLLAASVGIALGDWQAEEGFDEY